MSNKMKELVKIQVFKLSDGTLVEDASIAAAQQRSLDLQDMLLGDNFGVDTDDGWYTIGANDIDIFLTRNREFILEYLK